MNNSIPSNYVEHLLVALLRVRKLSKEFVETVLSELFNFNYRQWWQSICCLALAITVLFSDKALHRSYCNYPFPFFQKSIISIIIPIISFLLFRSVYLFFYLKNHPPTFPFSLLSSCLFPKCSTIRLFHFFI